MNKFESGKTYTARSICDHNCIFTVNVIKRTAKTILAYVDNSSDPKRLRITERNGEEMVWPHGSYSMAPIVIA